MAESSVNAYATKSDNTAATAPTPVAVVNDGVADRQIVVLGAGDGTTALNDGSAAHPIRTDPVGTTIQPVSAVSLPLPTGAALETGGNLAAAKADLDTIVTNTGKIPASPAQESGNLATVATNTGRIPAKGAAATVNSMPVNIASDQTVPVSASSLPLPTGAANSANQTTANTSLTSVDSKLVTAKTDDYDTGVGTDTVQSVGIALPGSGGHVVGGTSANPFRTDPTGNTTQPANIAAINGYTPDTNSGLKSTGTQRVVIATDQPQLTNPWKVDGSATTQPISVSSLPLPSGAAQDATLTGGTQQTKITDGTNTANVLKSDGTAAGQNAELVAGTFLSIPFTTNTIQAVGTTDAGNYRWVSVQITGQGTGSLVAFQVSNDNVTWTTNALSVPTTNTTPAATSSSATGLWSGPIHARYFRLNVTGINAGTTAGTVTFFTSSPVTKDVTANQGGSWTVGSNSATGSAVPANAFFIGQQNSSNNLVAVNTRGKAGSTGASGDTLTAVAPYTYNGSTHDTVIGNITAALIAAGATTGQTVTLTTYNARSLALVVNVSAYTSGTLNIAISGVTSSGYTYPLISSVTGLAATGVSIYRVFPGANPSAGLVANDLVPRTVQIVISGTFVATYGIDYELSV